jgi:hypothetical protein
MSRRASLPGAAELFRTTSVTENPAPTVVEPPAIAPLREVPAEPPTPVEEAAVPVGRTPRPARRVRPVGERNTSGRQRHDEKITVYCSAEELLDLETARLRLRAEHGIAVDRGRIVREAVAVVLADLDAKGETSILVRRLRDF